MRKLGVAVLVTLTLTGAASAQTADWRFHWQQGQMFHYRVQHSTDVAEVINGSKVQTKSKIDLMKRWEVVAVDAQGIATLNMSITQMRNEQTRPSGDVMLFDSQAPDKSTPELREQMSKFIGKTLAVLRVDGQGKVVEVKQGVASRYEAEPPLAFTLPPNPVQAGQTWQRDYTITLDPPQGTGEKHAAKQQYVCSKIDGSLATVSITTGLTQMPESKMEQLPLLQKLTEGEVIFDLNRGRLQSARLVINRHIEGHQGAGSTYHFQSVYTEQIVE
ncbi:MAG TPA: hypothetical protein VE988_12260 [Gemmataceae bacterium]|nr:hypothetical protein [Gemmataceae bacterium]